MAMVDNALVVKAPSSVVAAGSAHVVESMDVPTSLAHQFINKLRARNAEKQEIEAAEKMFRQIRFEDYEERSLARLMSFAQEKSDTVIEKFCKAQGLPDDTAEGLKMAAAHLDSDRSAETWIKFQQGEEGEFFVNFLAMQRVGTQIHMGLARHHVKFRLAPFAYESKSHEYGFYTFWQHFGGQNETYYNRDGEGADKKAQSLSLEEINMLENYFLLKAMKKFTEDFPANRNHLSAEDKVYLTMGSD